ncbi:hypothetical protein HDU91_002635, partial [Kappamyces sp. JEL0680]
MLTQRLLVGSYFLTTWNVRSDEWATALFLSELFPHSLLPVSLYSLIASTVNILGSTFVGQAIDKCNRRIFLQTALFIQKLCIVASALALWSITDFELHPVPSAASRPLNLAYGAVVLSGSILKLANTATTICVEKDWAKVIAKSNIELSALNAQLKRVDLVSKLVAPLVVSAVVSWTNISIGLLIIVSVGTASVIVEYFLILRVYGLEPLLATKTEAAGEMASPAGGDSVAPVPQGRPSSDSIPVDSQLGTKALFKSTIFLTCLAISFLYMNVLSFGSVMVSYLVSRQVTPTVIAIGRGISALFGILATMVFKFLSSRLGLIRLGEWSLWLEFGCLGVAIASFFVPESYSNLSIGLLLGGVSLSRFGLWQFDMCQSQLLQEVLENDIGSAFGVQMMLQNIFDLLAYGTT